MSDTMTFIWSIAIPIMVVIIALYLLRRPSSWHAHDDHTQHGHS